MVEGKERVQYFDCLRVLATFAVVVLHVAAANWRQCDVTTMQWQAMNLYDSLVRWSVPVFVMISGALFLGRKQTLSSLLKKNILRLAVAYAVWSCIYAVAEGGGVKQIVFGAIVGEYHLWFIPMIVGLYLCVPLLQKLVEDEKLTEYLLVLAVAFQFAIPQGLQMVTDFAPSALKTLAAAVQDPLQDMHFHMALGYVGYFVAGYALSRKELSRRSKGLLYAAAVAGAAVTAVLTAAVSLRSGKATTTYYEYCTLHVLAMSLGVFVWVKERGARWVKGKAAQVLSKLSKYSFGAYLVHVLLLNLLEQQWGIHSLTLHPLVSIPLISAAVFAASMAISALLHRIPVVNKYIV